MTGRIVEMAYEKGWGRVELDDGRILSFDTAACRQGIPDVGARVELELAPSSLGGEKVASVRVEDTWECLPGELPCLETARTLVLLRDGVVRQAPGGGDGGLAPGETGYAVLEVRRGVVGHSVAWASSAYDREGERDERLATVRKADLPEEVLAGFRDWVARELRDVSEDVQDPDLDESTIHDQDLRDLQADLVVARRLGLDTRAYEP